MIGRGMDRREFIRLILQVGAAGLGGGWLSACSRGWSTDPLPATHTPIPLPTSTLTAPSIPTDRPSVGSPTVEPTEEDLRTTIALVRTEDRAAGVEIALGLLGINPVKGKTVFLKPNFNSDDPAPGSTHPEVLVAVLRALGDMGADKIRIGDRSGMGNTQTVMRNLGLITLAEEWGIDVLMLDQLPLEDWHRFHLQGGNWSRGFPIARPLLDAEAVVQACCLKTHRYGGHFTMSLKNSVGLVAKQVPGEAHDYMTELHNSPFQREMIAEINAAYRPDLILMDGVEAFVRGGPARGEVVHSQVVVAGVDRVAVDAVGVAILREFGTTPAVQTGAIFEQAQIARAVQLGLGIQHPDQIDWATPDQTSREFANRLQAHLHY